jgi:hypothetical protein
MSYDFDEIEELVATIDLECQDRWKAEILDKMTDDDLNAFIAQSREHQQDCSPGLGDSDFVKFCLYEARVRYAFQRAKIVGMPYCVYHDCNSEHCPPVSMTTLIS